jgi:MFS family permease
MFVLVGIAFATAVLPMALTQQANPLVRPQAHFALLRLYRVSPVGVACCLAAGLINGAYYSMVPVFLELRHYGSESVAAYISAAMVAGLLVQYPVGILSDRFGRRPVMIGSLILALAVTCAMVLAGPISFVAVAVLGFLFSGVTAPLYGLGAQQTNDRMERGDYVAASGGLLFTWSLGSAVSPGIAGLIMGRAGATGLFFYLGVVLFALGLFVLARMQARGEVPRERRGTFVPAPSAPPRHSELASRVIQALRHPGATAPGWRAPPRNASHPGQH